MLMPVTLGFEGLYNCKKKTSLRSRAPTVPYSPALGCYNEAGPGEGADGGGGDVVVTVAYADSESFTVCVRESLKALMPVMKLLLPCLEESLAERTAAE